MGIFCTTIRTEAGRILVLFLLGAKEAGETSLIAFIPAFTNAVADALGVRPLDLPVTPDKLMELIENKKEE